MKECRELKCTKICQKSVMFKHRFLNSELEQFSNDFVVSRLISIRRIIENCHLQPIEHLRFY